MPELSGLHAWPRRGGNQRWIPIHERNRREARHQDVAIEIAESLFDPFPTAATRMGKKITQSINASKRRLVVGQTLIPSVTKTVPPRAIQHRTAEQPGRKQAHQQRTGKEPQPDRRHIDQSSLLIKMAQQNMRPAAVRSKEDRAQRGSRRAPLAGSTSRRGR